MTESQAKQFGSAVEELLNDLEWLPLGNDFGASCPRCCHVRPHHASDCGLVYLKDKARLLAKGGVTK